MFLWEKELLEEFFNILCPVCLMKDIGDVWAWKLDIFGEFSAKSANRFLASKAVGSQTLSPSASETFKFLWKSIALSLIVRSLGSSCWI